MFWETTTGEARSISTSSTRSDDDSRTSAENREQSRLRMLHIIESALEIVDRDDLFDDESEESGGVHQ